MAVCREEDALAACEAGLTVGADVAAEKVLPNAPVKVHMKPAQRYRFFRRGCPATVMVPVRLAPAGERFPSHRDCGRLRLPPASPRPHPSPRRTHRSHIRRPWGEEAPGSHLGSATHPYTRAFSPSAPHVHLSMRMLRGRRSISPGAAFPGPRHDDWCG